MSDFVKNLYAVLFLLLFIYIAVKGFSTAVEEHKKIHQLYRDRIEYLEARLEACLNNKPECLTLGEINTGGKSNEH